LSAIKNTRKKHARIWHWRLKAISKSFGRRFFSPERFANEEFSKLPITRGHEISKPTK
jgi:hypothetical protein